MKHNEKKILLAQPRGFCAGVVRAIDIVERALQKHGAPVYVRHEIVHNKYVVNDLRQKGAIFVEEVDEIPNGAVTVFSAHGVSRKVESDAKSRELYTFDATCPLVTKVHKQGQRYAKKDYEIIMIGHAGHAEVEGTLGQIDGTVHLIESTSDVENLEVMNPNKLSYVTQTTLSVDDTRDIIDALKTRFPAIEGPDIKDICYATQNRQQAVRDMAPQIDLLLVIGAKNSSNSNRLREIGTEMGMASYLIDDASALKAEWLDGKNIIGVTAGASAPEVLVDALLNVLGDEGYNTIELLDGIHENVQFNIPVELRHIKSSERVSA
ncbi:MAG: 4-hydroxy-3-methylbut-2-enyl diphosphate reductase [Litorimonas sp.]